MRMTLIALMLTVASAAAAAQTTEDAPDGRSWLEIGQLFDEFAELFGYAPVGDVREREAALNEAEAALEERTTTVQAEERAVRRRRAAVQADERAAAQHEAALAQRERDALSQRQEAEAAVSEREKEAAQIEAESRGIAWAAVILGAAVAGWSLWRLQPSTVARLNQRRRAAEQSLASMLRERDEAEGQLRKRAGALTAAKRKNTLLRKALDEAEASRREAESTVTQLNIDLEDSKRKNAWIRTAREDAEGKRREAEATITRLRVELDDAKRKAAEADGSRSTQERTARQVLGVPVGASRNDVRAAWKRVAFTVHPDRCRGPEAERLMQLANDALDCLKAT